MRCVSISDSKNFSYSSYDPIERSLDFARDDNSKTFVFKMPLALLRLCVFVLAQNIFVELHLGAKEVLEPSFDPLSILQHFLRDVIGVNVDANRADDSEFLSFDRNRRAFEFSRADLQLVVQLVLVQELATFQIYQQICGAVAQMT